MIDLTGEKFGRLTVVELSHRTPKLVKGKQSGYFYYYKCLCECGNTKIVLKSDLTRGRVKSCGCLRNESQRKANLIHGQSNTRLFRIWVDMRRRITNPKRKAYPNYGGRGIKICPEWENDFVSFYNWAIENGYNDNLTIDRIDVNGDYCPENCRWVTWKEQMINRRATHFITFNGITKCFSDWARFLNVTRHILYSRVEKFGEQEAIRRLFMEEKYDSI